jgi:hypothetical protein
MRNPYRPAAMSASVRSDITLPSGTSVSCMVRCTARLRSFRSWRSARFRSALGSLNSGGTTRSSPSQVSATGVEVAIVRNTPIVVVAVGIARYAGRMQDASERLDATGFGAWVKLETQLQVPVVGHDHLVHEVPLEMKGLIGTRALVIQLKPG